MLAEEEGGMEKIASGIEYYASLGNIVKIANGDMFQGTYVSSSLRGLPMLDVLNELDIDAFVIGNHEFDWGFDEMKKYNDGNPANGEAEFPFLGANIYDKLTGEMVDWLEPYTVVDAGGIKIGIIGIIGEVESSIMASHIADYDFVDPSEIVEELASELRTDKDCDAVIVAIHGNYTFATYTGSSRIDGIFAGHSHSPNDDVITKDDGSKLCVLQNGGYGESFAALTLKFDKSGNLTDTDGKLNYTYNYSANGILSSVFEKYAEYMTIGNEVLFTAEEDLTRREVGYQVARSMYVKYNVSFGIVNTGGVRTTIESGEVTYAEVFQILPFENEVYLVTLTGELLRNYLTDNSSSIYWWGINVDSLSDSQEYTIAIVDYVYLGSYFADYRNDSCIDTDDLLRDVFIELILGSV